MKMKTLGFKPHMFLIMITCISNFGQLISGKIYICISLLTNIGKYDRYNKVHSYDGYFYKIPTYSVKFEKKLFGTIRGTINN